MNLPQTSSPNQRPENTQVTSTTTTTTHNNNNNNNNNNNKIQCNFTSP
jgi:hypothetical protein